MLEMRLMFHLVCNVDDHVKVCKEGTQTHIVRRESEEEREREKDNAWIGFEVKSNTLSIATTPNDCH